MDPMTIFGIASGLGSLFSGLSANKNKGEFDQISTLLPEQQNALQSLLGGLGGAQGSGLELISQLLSGDNNAFSQFEAPYKRQFEQETVPGIAERFAGAGSHGSMNSSALQQTLGQSGRELSEQLASLRGGLQQNALTQLQGLLGTSLSPTFENVYRQPQAGFLGGLSSGLGQGASGLATMNLLKSLGGLGGPTQSSGMLSSNSALGGAAGGTY